jgi:RNA polymerase sigma factor (sigma-70 family)
MSDDSLLKLIDGCKKSDRACQKELFFYMYNFGMSIASRYARNLQDAEEIANDGFYKMLHKIESYPDHIPFRLWVRKIIINCGIDHFRKFQAKEVTLVNMDTSQSQNAGEVNLDSEYLLEMIRQLSPSYRMVFVLFVLEGYSHEEIALHLGISEGTSKSNLSKARKNLQTLILKHNQHINYGG